MCRFAVLQLFSLSFFFSRYLLPRALHSFPTRRSSDLLADLSGRLNLAASRNQVKLERTDQVTDSMVAGRLRRVLVRTITRRSEEHTSELQSHVNLVCRLLLEKKKKKNKQSYKLSRTAD